MKLSQSLESKSSDSFGLEGECFQNLSDSAHASSEGLSSVDSTAAGVLLCLGDFVVGLVLLDKGDSASGTFLCLDDMRLESDGVVIAET